MVEDAELAELAQRIANARATRAELEAQHARRAEDAVRPAPDPTHLELRARIEAARARLDELAGMKKAPRRGSLVERSTRDGLLYGGLLISAPGALTLPFYVWNAVRHQEELQLALVLSLGLPVVLGLGLVLRARFAKFNARTGDVGGDFL